MDEPPDNQIDAMRRAIRAAEEAAEQRRLAKEASLPAPAARDTVDEALVADALAALLGGEEPAGALELDVEEDVDALIAQLEASVPDPEGPLADGELVVLPSGTPPRPWYLDAAEAGMPEAIKHAPGGKDVKQLLQALLVEMGDVKRTNAMILERLAGLEEKVERVNRHLKPPR